MKLKTLIVAASFPVIAVIAVLNDPMNRDLSAQGRAVDSVSSSVMPAWVQEPIPFPAESSIGVELPGASDSRTHSDGEDNLEWELLGSIAQNLQQSIETPIEAMQRVARESERYGLDPEWPTIPAVPGVAGFELQKCPGSQCLSDRLARETDDAAWARPMEARIMGEVARLSPGGLGQLSVVCRQATCGVLLPSSPGSQRLSLMLTSGKLADELGFVHHSYADRTGFQAIYLTTRDEPPERRRQ